MNSAFNDLANPTTGSVHWSEIFDRHEAVLSSHMELLAMVKGQTEPGDRFFQTVTSMVNKTVQAINRSKVVRKQMMNRPTGTPSAPLSSNNPQSDAEANTRKKRRRISREKEPIQTESDSTRETRSSGSSGDTSSQLPFEQDGDVTSTSLGTEDISAEVQRRLKIKEEHRRKRETPKQDKRKRDSLASNDGASPNTSARPRKKRAKMENERKRGGDMEDGHDLRKKSRKSP